MSRHGKFLTVSAAAISLALLGCSTSTSGAAPGVSESVATASSLTAEPAKRVRQKAVLVMHPQIAQPGATPKGSNRAHSAMAASFKPRKNGRPIVLQRKAGSRWVTVSKARQNRRGIVELAAPYAVRGKPAVYRVAAKRYQGLGKVASRGVATNKWGAADFTDEFSGTELGSSWAARNSGYEPASKRRCSKPNPGAVGVGDGVVRLSVRNDPERPSLTDELNGTEKCGYGGKNYEWRWNGVISTQGQQSMKYGYAAARVKFQPRRGQHASFWMAPESPAADEGSPRHTGAEIDVIEWFGDKHPNGGLTSFIYYYPDDGKDGRTGKKVGGFIKQPSRFGRDWASKYHVFSVEWTPSRYIFRIDGKETFRTNKGVSGQEQYLILSLLSSDYELGYLGREHRLPQTMAVDWVRYWER
jgi:beta-glucanase (GH16 family)